VSKEYFKYKIINDNNNIIINLYLEILTFNISLNNLIEMYFNNSSIKNIKFIKKNNQ
jgi:hypothetical protein